MIIFTLIHGIYITKKIKRFFFLCIRTIQNMYFSLRKPLFTSPFKNQFQHIIGVTSQHIYIIYKYIYNIYLPVYSSVRCGREQTGNIMSLTSMRAVILSPTFNRENLNHSFLSFKNICKLKI